MNIEPIKPESLYTDDERRLRVKISLLEDRLANNDQIIQVLADKNSELETTIRDLNTELDTVRKSTLYNFSVFMQNNIEWMSKIGTFILGCIASPTMIYIVQKALSK
jgi:hypothetical protein